MNRNCDERNSTSWTREEPVGGFAKLVPSGIQYSSELSVQHCHWRPVTKNKDNGKWYSGKASMAASALQGVQTVLIYWGNVQSNSLVNVLKTEMETVVWLSLTVGTPRNDRGTKQRPIVKNNTVETDLFTWKDTILSSEKSKL